MYPLGNDRLKAGVNARQAEKSSDFDPVQTTSKRKTNGRSLTKTRQMPSGNIKANQEVILVLSFTLDS